MLDEIINNIKSLHGVDLIYFIKNEDENYKIIQEFNKTSKNNYYEQIVNILKSEPIFNNISAKLYSKSFHTYTMLNEAGLIIISKINQPDSLYMVIIAGESEPVDLINLLKTCNESRISFANLPNVI